jgi:GrpB-like predicted nucleotidyltransferase (UPF0157 family)
MPYGGIKVLEVPVRVIGPYQAGQAEPLFVQNYGIGFVGHYLAAFLLKELVSEVLSHAQFLGRREEISFDLICELVVRIHRHFYPQIRDHLTTNHVLDFFLAGFCPQSGRVRVAKFSVDAATRQPEYREILQELPFSFATIGVTEGQARFHELMEMNLSQPRCKTHFVAFRRLWDVIRDPDIRKVKGAVQYGQFDGSDFKLAGAFELRREAEQLVPRTFIRGTDVQEIHGAGGIHDLHITYSFGNPFAEDIQSFDVARTFWELRRKPDGTEDPARHVIDEQITMVPHDARWARWFQDEMAFLRMEGIAEAIPVEHIGSTAVPGLAAIPCVDMMVGVETLGDVQTKPFNLQEHGYEYLGDRLMPGQRSYRKRGDRAFNVHVVERGGEFWTNAIQLREYLRQHPEECTAYSIEKIRIINPGSWTLVRYLNERANYFNQLLERATANDEAE